MKNLIVALHILMLHANFIFLIIKPQAIATHTYPKEWKYVEMGYWDSLPP